MNNIFKKSGVLILAFSIFSCNNRENPSAAPDLTTIPVSGITQTTGISGGNITNDGGTTVLSRGVCWSTETDPTTSNNKTSDNAGVGSYTSIMSGLSANASYYVRAYATNSIGTSYGNEFLFKTYAVFDADGNGYHSVSIGTQTWLEENLETTRYCNGDSIGTTNPADLDLLGESTPKFQWAYEGNELNVAVYGRLYTWYSVTDSRRVCPIGWHVPADSEWTTLTNYLGGEDIAGGKLKETDIAHWQNPNIGATNETGFTALPGGQRTSDGYFFIFGRWWSATESGPGIAHGRTMSYKNTKVSGDLFDEKDGISVRCVKD